MAWKWKLHIISIHAPTRGATVPTTQAVNASGISIHAPTRGATLMGDRQSNRDRISIHAPTRGATLTVAEIKALAERFQSTLLQEERLYNRHYNDTLETISIHAPTRGATHTLFKRFFLFVISIHAPTRGATLFVSMWRIKYMGFQSTLLQEERRRKLSKIYRLYYISIHAPTRGATICNCINL